MHGSPRFSIGIRPPPKGDKFMKHPLMNSPPRMPILVRFNLLYLIPRHLSILFFRSKKIDTK